MNCGSWLLWGFVGHGRADDAAWRAARASASRG